MLLLKIKSCRDFVRNHDVDQKENSVSLKYKKIARLIGLEATLKLSKEFGSEAFYLPKLDAHGGALSRVRNRMIVNDLKTHFGPLAPLARKYGVSSRHIYDLIEKRRTDKK